MDKVTFVKAAMSLAAGAVLLTACQGQNTFKRESDPTRGYNLQGTSEYNAQQHNEQLLQRAEALKKPCGIPVKFSVAGERGLSADFREGQEKSIQIVVNKIDDMPDADQNWDVRTVDSPCGEKCVQLVSKTDKTATLKFSWTAPNADQVADGREYLTLRYVWPTRVNCSQTPITETVTLNIKKSEDGPIVTFPGLKSDVKFGDSFKFAIQSDDAASKFQQIANKKENNIIDASKAAQCVYTGRVVDANLAGTQKASVIDCTFDSRLLPDEQIKSLLGSGQTATAVFTVKVNGAKGSTTQAARVNVKFEKIESKPQTPIASSKPQGAKS